MRKNANKLSLPLRVLHYCTQADSGLGVAGALTPFHEVYAQVDVK